MTPGVAHSIETCPKFASRHEFYCECNVKELKKLPKPTQEMALNLPSIRKLLCKDSSKLTDEDRKLITDRMVEADEVLNEYMKSAATDANNIKTVEIMMGFLYKVLAYISVEKDPSTMEFIIFLTFCIDVWSKWRFLPHILVPYMDALNDLACFLAMNGDRHEAEDTFERGRELYETYVLHHCTGLPDDDVQNLRPESKADSYKMREQFCEAYRRLLWNYTNFSDRCLFYALSMGVGFVTKETVLDMNPLLMPLIGQWPSDPKKRHRFLMRHETKLRHFDRHRDGLGRSNQLLMAITRGMIVRELGLNATDPKSKLKFLLAAKELWHKDRMEPIIILLYLNLLFSLVEFFCSQGDFRAAMEAAQEGKRLGREVARLHIEPVIMATPLDETRKSTQMAQVEFARLLNHFNSAISHIPHASAVHTKLRRLAVILQLSLCIKPPGRELNIQRAVKLAKCFAEQCLFRSAGYFLALASAQLRQLKRIANTMEERTLVRHLEVNLDFEWIVYNISVLHRSAIEFEAGRQRSYRDFLHEPETFRLADRNPYKKKILEGLCDDRWEWMMLYMETMATVKESYDAIGRRIHKDKLRLLHFGIDCIKRYFWYLMWCS